VRKDVFKSLTIIKPRSKPIFTKFDLNSCKPKLVKHVLIVEQILRRALAEALHPGHDCLLIADILDEDGGSKSRWDFGEGEMAYDALARLNHFTFLLLIIKFPDRSRISQSLFKISCFAS